MLSRPWKTIPRHGNRTQVAATLAAEVATLAAEDDGLAGVVLGYPRSLGGEATDQTAAVVRAGRRACARRSSVPLVLQDERLSSREAESLLARRLKNWRDRKPLLDAASAAVILQDYLDGRAGPPAIGDCTEDVPLVRRILGRVLVALVAIVIVTALAVGLWGYLLMTRPYKGYPDAETFVEIVPGSSPQSDGTSARDCGRRRRARSRFGSRSGSKARGGACRRASIVSTRR